MHSDNGKQYFDNTLIKYLQNEGITQHSYCVDTPQQNGAAERKNRHLLIVVRFQFSFKCMFQNYIGGETVLTTTYFVDLILSRVLNSKSPIKTLQKKNPHFLWHWETST